MSRDPGRLAVVDAAAWQRPAARVRGARLRIGDLHDGNPLAGIRIDARGPGGATATRTTDARGLVELGGLAPGTWSLTVRAKGYAPATRELSIRASRVFN